MLDEEASTSYVRIVLIPTRIQPTTLEPREVVPQRSGRVSHKPDRYMSHGDALVAVSDMDMEDSVSHSQTKAGSKSNI